MSVYCVVNDSTSYTDKRLKTLARKALKELKKKCPDLKDFKLEKVEIVQLPVTEFFKRWGMIKPEHKNMLMFSNEKNEISSEYSVFAYKEG